MSFEITNLTKYHDILGVKRINGYRCINVDVDLKDCFISIETKKKWNTVSTLSTEFKNFYNSLNRFDVSLRGDYEMRYFHLLKNNENIWYAANELKFNKMIYPIDMDKLSYEYIEEIYSFLEENSQKSDYKGPNY